jgi:hypothetical protein
VRLCALVARTLPLALGAHRPQAGAGLLMEVSAVGEEGSITEVTLVEGGAFAGSVGRISAVFGFS